MIIVESNYFVPPFLVLHEIGNVRKRTSHGDLEENWYKTELWKRVKSSLPLQVGMCVCV